MAIFFALFTLGKWTREAAVSVISAIVARAVENCFFFQIKSKFCFRRYLHLCGPSGWRFFFLFALLVAIGVVVLLIINVFHPVDYIVFDFVRVSYVSQIQTIYVCYDGRNICGGGDVIIIIIVG